MSLEDTARISHISYDTLKDMESGRLQTISANDLYSLEDTLDISGDKVCYDYFTREPDARLTLVHVHVEILRDFLMRTGMNPNQLATRADVAPQIVYAFVKRGKRACKAITAVKLARAMSVRPEEFCPAFALYSAEDMELVEPNIEAL
jgi:plasmid maintenance system antidote protein VapI